MKFKTILYTLSLCFLLALVSCKNGETEKTASFLEGLTEIPEAEFGKYAAELDKVVFYSTDGATLEEEELNDYFSEGARPVLYKDANDKLILGVVAPPTDEQKKSMEAMMAQFEAEEAKLQEAIGTPAKSFDLVDYEGNQVTSNELKGKITVVNFWFKECKPCIQEMPELNELVETYKDNANVQFMGFSTTAKDRLPSFFEKHNFDYRIIPDSQSYAMQNGITGYPTNMIIDQEGNIAFLKTGFIPGIAENIKAEIENLL
ncbi:TlpA disulfide reductase family protein [Dokdonia sp.]|uniref:TlpA family protein disulfide reductase n=1 Tax=Dokdonia sp. TaxID=2024995 RepID=UPI0032669911